MNLYLKNRKSLLITFALFSSLHMPHNIRGVEIDLYERSIDKEIFQESFKVQEEQNLPYFDIPEPGFSQVESTQQIKNNYKNVLTLVLQKKFAQATTKVTSLIQD
ncbi:hypothetical protein bplSymb_SCF01603P018 [Bathymodiolus platifrons methanotrophic gill symbiont]|uniref:hypothetical protein n=1 Tax=Bathymodiolus platifrons methanotrophic gill symbiont TaxID=113268 RepID=UPI000B41B69D|nr:hypothetical protein [Bathymodiolus platifrons methanotrophic gill symbiont]GAW86012.1 hypothetical protein bplSymb_SCF01603P018 [Bathymodiolus platifrons methanotrophic gill symbiont]